MTAAEIAETLRMPLSTVSGILTRAEMGQAARRPRHAARPANSTVSTRTGSGRSD